MHGTFDQINLPTVRKPAIELSKPLIDTPLARGLCVHTMPRRS